MKSKKEKAVQRDQKQDLLALYRPLGLKAVLAAHTVLKSKPLSNKHA